MIVQASTMCSLYMYNLIQLKYMGKLPCISTSDGGGGVCVCVCLWGGDVHVCEQMF